MDHIKPSKTTVKKIIVMLLVSAGALVGMGASAGALTTSVIETRVGGTGGGDGGRDWACTGNDQTREAICVDGPVPTSSAIRIGG